MHRCFDVPVIQEDAFFQPVLRHRERIRIREDRAMVGKPERCFDGHVFKFIGNDVDRCGERIECCLIVINGNRLGGCDIEGG